MINDLIMTGKCLSSIPKASLPHSILPPECKMAHISPLQEGGAVDKPNNYRPISLASISSIPYLARF